MSDEANADGGSLALHVQVGKLEERVGGIQTNLGGQIEGLSKQLSQALAEFRGGYATTTALAAVKDDIAVVSKRVDGIWSTIGWTAKLIVAGVMAGLMGLLFAKGGVPHP